MNFREKQVLLANIEAEVDYVNNSVTGFKGLAVDTQFFTDEEIVPTIYILVQDGSDLSNNKVIELELSEKFDNVTFDIVGYDHYLKNISGAAQMFYQAK